MGLQCWRRHDGKTAVSKTDGDPLLKGFSSPAGGQRSKLGDGDGEETTLPLLPPFTEREVAACSSSNRAVSTAGLPHPAHSGKMAKMSAGRRPSQAAETLGLSISAEVF